MASLADDVQVGANDIDHSVADRSASSLTTSQEIDHRSVDL
jgi:hypothetical protein